MRTCIHALPFLRVSLFTLGLLGAAGCASPPAQGDPGALGVSAERLVAETPAQTLALQVEALLDGPSSSCKNCHSVTRAAVQSWGQAMLKVENDCIVKPGLTPLQRVNCLRVDPSSGTSSFSAH
ncbi:MAG TPA: hypothetical protein VFS00_00965, partial [Polyangiaceae bacterium]|nr:hypothetical protein [Polyangiaceae bacterium]